MIEPLKSIYEINIDYGYLPDAEIKEIIDSSVREKIDEIIEVVNRIEKVITSSPDEF